MPKRPKDGKLLSWYPARSCWRKKYKGKTYYLASGGICQGEADQEGYLTAVAEFADIKRQVDSGVENPARANPARASTATATAKRRRKLDINLPLKVLHTEGFRDYSHDPDLPGELLTVPHDVTVDALVEAFIAEYRQLVDMGERAVSTYRGAKDALADFQAFCERYTIVHINQIEPRQLSHYLKCYRDKQLELIGKGEHSPHTAKRRLRFVRKLCEWAYENEYLDQLPRKVNGNYAKVPLPDPDPQPFTLDQVKELWKAATTKTKFSRKSYRNALYVAMGLNLGYRAGDISTLKHEHLQEHNGDLLIVRKREKTGSPQIHKLWRLTADLLRDEMTDPEDHTLCLLDERGGRLVTESIDGKTAKTDCIGRCFHRVKAKIGWKGEGMGHSVLRDTSAQALKDNGYAKHVIKQFLGHKERDVMRHYVQESIESRREMFEATDWLDTYYGLKM